MEYKFPTIRCMLRNKHVGEDGKQLIYVSYAYRNKTNFISTKIRTKAEMFDPAKQRLKARETTSLVFNNTLTDIIRKIEGTCSALIDDDVEPTFENFKVRYSKPRGQPINLYAEGLKWLERRENLGDIARSTARMYTVSLSDFYHRVGERDVRNLSRKDIEDWMLITISRRGVNCAHQYARFLQVIYTGLIKQNKLKIDNIFLDFDLKVERISGKKTMTTEEMQKIEEYYSNLSKEDPSREILRRFLICSKTLRFSDTNVLEKTHFVEIIDPEKGLKYYVLQKAAIKTGKPIFAPIQEQYLHLLEWNKDGRLFVPLENSRYNVALKKLTQKIIGRKITSHYGRHYAADQMIDGAVSGKTIQNIMGLSNATMTDIYAVQQKVTALREFHQKMSTSMAREPIKYELKEIEASNKVKAALWEKRQQFPASADEMALLFGCGMRNFYKKFNPDDNMPMNITLQDFFRLCFILNADPVEVISQYK